MKINPLTSRNSFGYNNQYHDEVKNKLSRSKKDKETARILFELEKKALSIEDEIIKLEETPEGVHETSYEILTDFLMNFKTRLSNYMEKYFPKLQYNKNSIKEYSEEIGECKQAEEQYWRQELCKYLAAVQLIEDINEDDFNLETEDPKEKIQNVSQENNTADISKILSLYTPASSSPKSLDDVIGLRKTKEMLQEDIIEYIKNPELKELDKEEYGINPVSTILFYGPPGCGKTYITEALASESGIKMYKMDISKIGSKFVNQTSVNIQNAFDFLEKEAQKDGKPVLLFMDEIDAIAMKRESSIGGSGENLKTTSTLLKLIQEAKDKNIIIIAATNRRDIIDNALLDRFEAETYFGLSDKNGIKEILKTKLDKVSKGKNLAQNEEKIDELAEILTGYSNRSIVHIFEKAAKLAKKNSRSDITFEIFKQAITECDYEKIIEENYRKKTYKKMGFE